MSTEAKNLISHEATIMCVSINVGKNKKRVTPKFQVANDGLLVCRHWQRGQCRFGAKCGFAHYL